LRNSKLRKERRERFLYTRPQKKEGACVLAMREKIEKRHVRTPGGGDGKKQQRRRGIDCRKEKDRERIISPIAATRREGDNLGLFDQ